MAIAAVANLVQIRASSVPTTLATLPSNVTNGNLLVVAGGIWNTSANTTITVSRNSGSATLGSMTTLITPTGLSYSGGVGQSWISYGFVTGSGSLEILVDPQQAAGNYITGGTIEFSGVNATPLDTDGGEALPASSATPTDTITTGTANALIVGVAINPGANTIWGVGSGYTQIDEDESAAIQTFSAQYQIVTAAGSYNVDWTMDLAHLTSIYDASFKEAVAAGVDITGVFMMS